MQKFTAIIEKEEDGYVSLCPELDIASQGDTVEDAKNNLTEAIELFLEIADPSEINQRLEKETLVTQLGKSVGKPMGLSGKEVCKVFEQVEFINVRQKGSHIIMQKKVEGSTITFPVPNHSSIEFDTLLSIIRQSETEELE